MDFTELQQTQPKPVLVTLQNATQEGQLDKYHLLRMASEGQNTLELLVYVDFKDIVSGVDVSSTSREPGIYLALPSHIFTRLIEKDGAYVDSFLLPKMYVQPDSGAGLIMLQQIVGQSRDRTIATREPYYIRTDQEKIWVVQQQAERFFKKSPDKTPIPGTQDDEYLNQNKLLAHFAPATWNTIKSWAIKFGIPKPELGNIWLINTKDAFHIKAKHFEYYIKKKIVKSKNKF